PSELEMIKEIAGFHLSPQQKEVWLSQSGNASHAQTAILIEGELDRQVLRTAAGELASTHDILRTTFQRASGMSLPIQVVSDTALLSWNEIDLSRFNHPQQQQRLDSYFQQPANRPGDWEQGPILQFALLKLSSTRHILMITLPA